MFTDFIVEDPNAPQDRPRRPRVVVSCDYCRTKKIKCRHTPGQAKCNNCTEAGKRCTYRDRDRYQADRERVYATRLAELSSPSFPSSTGEAAGLTPPASSAYGSNYVVPVGDQGAMMTFYSVAPSGLTQQAPAASPSSPEATEATTFSQPETPQSATSDDGPTLLPLMVPATYVADPQFFSPVHTDAPSSAVMAPLIDVFFRHYSARFHFLRYDCIVGYFLTSTLGPFVSNCIAALAVPHARDVMELALTDLREAEMSYLAKAKSLVPEGRDVAMIDLAGITILAYAMRRAGDLEAFEDYVQRAIDAAYSLGLPDERHIEAIGETELHRAQLTALWQYILHLHQIMIEGDYAQESPRSTPPV